MPLFNRGEKNRGAIRRPLMDGVELVCPWCMRRFNSNEVHFRPTDPRNGVEKDEILDAFWNYMTDMEKGSQVKAIVPDINNPSQALQYQEVNNQNGHYRLLFSCADKFGNRVPQRICPHCHNKLPPSLGNSCNNVISILGYTQIGKTIYLTSLLHWLRTHLANSIQGGFFGFVDEEMSSFQNGQYANMLDGTIPATDVKYVSPLICEIGFSHPGYGSVSTIISFYDFPGEAANAEMDKIAANHIQNASAMMLLFDLTKTQTFWNEHIQDCIERLKKELDYALQQGKTAFAEELKTEIEKLEDSKRHPGEIWNSASGNYKPYLTIQQWIRQRMVVAIGDNVVDTRPVAFIGTKSDEICNGPRCRAKCNNTHGTLSQNTDYRRDNCCYDPNKAEHMNEMVKHYLLQDDNDLKNYINSKFSNHHYFAVSSLGTSYVDTEDGRRLMQLVPAWRVEEPLLWLLYQLGFIPQDSLINRRYDV